MKEKHGPEPLLFSGRKEGGGNSLGLAALNNVNRLWNTGWSLVVWYPAPGDEGRGILSPGV